MMNEYMFEVCRVAAIIIGALLAYYIIPVLKAYIAKYWDENLLDFVKSCVYAAQQTVENNADKKRYVLAHVGEWIRMKGMDISDEQIDILIESAVLAMKTETK